MKSVFVKVRNMMNNEQSAQLESRKVYLGERVTELDSLHAKMKALNDRINFIKQSQQTNSSDVNNSALVNTSGNSLKNQFAPVKRFEARSNPPLIAQVHPMRSTSVSGGSSPSSDSPTTPANDKRASPLALLKPQMPSPTLRFSDPKMPAPSPSISLSSNSPSHSPNTSAIKIGSNSSSIERFTPSPNLRPHNETLFQYNLKTAKVRPMQSENEFDTFQKSSSPVEQLNARYSYDNTSSSPNIIRDEYAKYEKAGPKMYSESEKIFGGNDKVVKPGSNSDSKSSGVYTTEENYTPQITPHKERQFEQGDSVPVIHQYPILQQFASWGVPSSSESDKPQLMSSAYDRLFPAPPPPHHSAMIEAEQQPSPQGEDELDTSKSSIHIDKTTGAKQKRRRSSLVNAEAGECFVL